jgi:hypothetical protein
LREDLFKFTIKQTVGFAALLEVRQNRPAGVSESGAADNNDNDDNEAEAR